ncbi:MAG: lactate utilization protein [Deltaproteobacteria bacterium]|nr:lactate utilization protein [Deltaproteobacteria bacterium]
MSQGQSAGAETNPVGLFTASAAKVSMGVSRTADLDGALAVALGLAQERLAQGPPQDGLDMLFLCGLPGALPEKYRALGAERGIRVIRDGLRAVRGWIGTAFSLASLAIAETATLVLSGEGEDARLSGMISLTHVIAVREEKILMALGDALPEVQAMMGRPGHVSFVSGPSRTADIERVLALGAHGPQRVQALVMGG